MRTDNKTRKEVLEALREGRYTFSELEAELKISSRSKEERTLIRALGEFSEMGLAKKNEDGRWSAADSVTSMTEKEYPVYMKHSEKIVSLGLASLILESSDMGFSEDYSEDSPSPGSLQSRGTEKPQSSSVGFTHNPAAQIPSSRIIWIDPDLAAIEAIALEDPTLAFADQEDPQVSHRIIKLETAAEELKPFALAHLAAYPLAISSLQRLREAREKCRSVWGRRPKKFYTSSGYGMSGLLGRDGSPTLGFGVTVEEKLDQLKETEVFGMPRYYSSVLPRPGENPTPKEVKEAKRWAGELNTAMEERVRAAQAFIGEAKILRQRVRNGTPLLGRCEVCPKVKIVS